METTLRILLVEDHAILREGVRNLLDREADMEVVGEAENGRTAMQKTLQLKPHLVLMDLGMPGINGTEAIAEVKRRQPDIKILTLTMHKTEEHLHAALKAGASGYMLKDDSYFELVTAIRYVAGGKLYLSPGICEKVVSGYLEKGELFSPSWESLSCREREVVKLIAEGYRNREIAQYLSLSPKTVEKHRSNVFKKLHLHSISEVTAYAFENGLVQR